MFFYKYIPLAQLLLSLQGTIQHSFYLVLADPFHDYVDLLHCSCPSLIATWFFFYHLFWAWSVCCWSVLCIHSIWFDSSRVQTVLCTQSLLFWSVVTDFHYQDIELCFFCFPAWLLLLPVSCVLFSLCLAFHHLMFVHSYSYSIFFNRVRLAPFHTCSLLQLHF